MSYELGRHLIGYEIQKVLGAIDLFESRNREHEAPIGMIGYGEGGPCWRSTRQLSTGESPRSSLAATSKNGRGLWQETIDRNVWSLLTEFGDAEVTGLIAPRRLTIEASQGPDVPGPPPAPAPNADRAASGRLVSPPVGSVRREFDRARRIYEQLDSDNCFLVEEAPAPGTETSLQLLIDAQDLRPDSGHLQIVSPAPDQEARMRRQFDQIVDYNHRLVRDSPQRRGRFWAKADASSVRAWKDSTQVYRDYIWDELIGRLPAPDRPASPKTRRIYDHTDFDGYEVVLDVWEDVFAYGRAASAQGTAARGERRPVVVAQARA